jgi:hypothetical protein
VAEAVSEGCSEQEAGPDTVWEVWAASRVSTFVHAEVMDGRLGRRFRDGDGAATAPSVTSATEAPPWLSSGWAHPDRRRSRSWLSAAMKGLTADQTRVTLVRHE